MVFVAVVVQVAVAQARWLPVCDGGPLDDQEQEGKGLKLGKGLQATSVYSH